MPIREEWIGSKKPATQADLADLQEDTHLEIDKAEQRIKKEIRKEIRDSEKRLESKLASKEAVQDVYDILQSIDKRLKDQGDLPAEVDKLKTRVFKLELRR